MLSDKMCHCKSWYGDRGRGGIKQQAEPQPSLERGTGKVVGACGRNTYVYIHTHTKYSDLEESDNSGLSIHCL